MNLIIPLQPVANQALTVSLGGQSCRITITMQSIIDSNGKGDGALYFSLTTPTIGAVISGAPMLDRVRLIPSGSSFVGQLAIVDTIAKTDPEYTGLGARYKLFYTNS